MDAKSWFYRQSFNGGTRNVNLGTPVVLKSAAGNSLTCKCGRILHWDEIKDGATDYYRATCCNLVMFEKKGVTK